ncbi:hypothetical protein CLOM_g12588 [Closterium sp. NIES-68]|nr:hypothetical protein CLOM_g12588 [Closterium sp. NIES-68]
MAATLQILTLASLSLLRPCWLHLPYILSCSWWLASRPQLLHLRPFRRRALLRTYIAFHILALILFQLPLSREWRLLVQWGQTLGLFLLDVREILDPLQVLHVLETALLLSSFALLSPSHPSLTSSHRSPRNRPSSYPTTYQAPFPDRQPRPSSGPSHSSQPSGWLGPNLPSLASEASQLLYLVVEEEEEEDAAGEGEGEEEVGKEEGLELEQQEEIARRVLAARVGGLGAGGVQWRRAQKRGEGESREQQGGEKERNWGRERDVPTGHVRASSGGGNSTLASEATMPLRGVADAEDENEKRLRRQFTALSWSSTSQRVGATLVVFGPAICTASLVLFCLSFQCLLAWPILASLVLLLVSPPLQPPSATPTAASFATCSYGLWLLTSSISHPHQTFPFPDLPFPTFLQAIGLLRFPNPTLPLALHFTMALLSTAYVFACTATLASSSPSSPYSSSPAHLSLPHATTVGGRVGADGDAGSGAAYSESAGDGGSSSEVRSGLLDGVAGGGSGSQTTAGLAQDSGEMVFGIPTQGSGAETMAVPAQGWLCFVVSFSLWAARLFAFSAFILLVLVHVADKLALLRAPYVLLLVLLLVYPSRAQAVYSACIAYSSLHLLLLFAATDPVFTHLPLPPYWKILLSLLGIPPTLSPKAITPPACILLLAYAMARARSALQQSLAATCSLPHKPFLWRLLELAACCPPPMAAALQLKPHPDSLLLPPCKGPPWPYLCLAYPSALATEANTYLILAAFFTILTCTRPSAVSLGFLLLLITWLWLFLWPSSSRTSSHAQDASEWQSSSRASAFQTSTFRASAPAFRAYMAPLTASLAATVLLLRYCSLYPELRSLLAAHFGIDLSVLERLGLFARLGTPVHVATADCATLLICLRAYFCFEAFPHVQQWVEQQQQYQQQEHNSQLHPTSQQGVQVSGAGAAAPSTVTPLSAPPTRKLHLSAKGSKSFHFPPPAAGSAAGAAGAIDAAIAAAAAAPAPEADTETGGTAAAAGVTTTPPPVISWSRDEYPLTGFFGWVGFFKRLLILHCPTSLPCAAFFAALYPVSAMGFGFLLLAVLGCLRLKAMRGTPRALFLYGGVALVMEFGFQVVVTQWGLEAWVEQHSAILQWLGLGLYGDGTMGTSAAGPMWALTSGCTAKAVLLAACLLHHASCHWLTELPLELQTDPKGEVCVLFVPPEAVAAARNAASVQIQEMVQRGGEEGRRERGAGGVGGVGGVGGAGGIGEGGGGGPGNGKVAEEVAKTEPQESVLKLDEVASIGREGGGGDGGNEKMGRGISGGGGAGGTRRAHKLISFRSWSVGDLRSADASSSASSSSFLLGGSGRREGKVTGGGKPLERHDEDQEKEEETVQTDRDSHVNASYEGDSVFGDDYYDGYDDEEEDDDEEDEEDQSEEAQRYRQQLRSMWSWVQNTVAHFFSLYGVQVVVLCLLVASFAVKNIVSLLYTLVVGLCIALPSRFVRLLWPLLVATFAAITLWQYYMLAGPPPLDNPAPPPPNNPAPPLRNSQGFNRFVYTSHYAPKSPPHQPLEEFPPLLHPQHPHQPSKHPFFQRDNSEGPYEAVASATQLIRGPSRELHSPLGTKRSLLGVDSDSPLQEYPSGPGAGHLLEYPRSSRPESLNLNPLRAYLLGYPHNSLSRESPGLSLYKTSGLSHSLFRGSRRPHPPKSHSRNCQDCWLSTDSRDSTCWDCWLGGIVDDRRILCAYFVVFLLSCFLLSPSSSSAPSSSSSSQINPSFPHDTAPHLTRWTSLPPPSLPPLETPRPHPSPTPALPSPLLLSSPPPPPTSPQTRPPPLGTTCQKAPTPVGPGWTTGASSTTSTSYGLS